MRKIVNGLLYDTQTAEEIESVSYSNPTDFNHYEEALYKTKGGRYFLAGEGNARSKYGQSVDQNTWGPGSRIIPLEAAEALEWCERHDVDPDIVTKEFKVEEA